ncbi:MAG TPA: N-acylglucosamine 2-epimerase [Chloroflexus aurantiacus]|jgi:N-acylglucosamine 2-epimerase|uniref:N-acylglucosamine 2-epimerase n=1 Tax=Chloroflexus aurantiacus (strain ATCC 29366 / DSM 635 / J-10-fl) TaxID=324602 RepID=A9WJ58_CHLAA|nr:MULTISPECIES: AGE family epimerase/isomerase [Chloroflexus]ABY34335.1 N-acylglucosamine 2-epimerase [Chloroflexus aurantiacus J-10-fl]RMG48121.1 MAG: N-acylglucosamine 2-epimerase [Chloroflexota bacterium]GIV95285.1 MAG: N-acylglucosamine 2-epimerase [Chloroflexus sp.]HBW68576.1 N-acylglucosamine 2-epimerase [Chloroflexus aurantiacus]
MLEAFANRYRIELSERVIPFWLRHSLDHQHGGYFSALDRDGTVYDTRKYVWLQGRAIWMFSRLYNTFEPRHDFLAAARLGVEFLRRHARDREGRVYFSLTRDGQPVFMQRKPYAAVFYQMGLAEYARATGDDSCLAEAREVFALICQWIANPGLLGRPSLPGMPVVSQLTDLLVVGMMALDMFTLTGEQEYSTAIIETIAGIVRHFDPERNIYRERVAPDGSVLEDNPDSRLFNPGHSLETAWIMLHLLEWQPDQALRKQALAAIRGSLELGWDQTYGGIFYFVDLAGRPTLQIESTMKLWWPHAEAIYALVLAATITGDRQWIEWLERIDAYTFRYFADPVYGEWFGYCDRRGEVALTSKGGNYKGFFHMPRALLFSIQAIERAGGKV